MFGALLRPEVLSLHTAALGVPLSCISLTAPSVLAAACCCRLLARKPTQLLAQAWLGSAVDMVPLGAPTRPLLFLGQAALCSWSRAPWICPFMKPDCAGVTGNGLLAPCAEKPWFQPDRWRPTSSSGPQAAGLTEISLARPTPGGQWRPGARGAGQHPRAAPLERDVRSSSCGRRTDKQADLTPRTAARPQP